jgi:hypothetical protein
LLKLDFVRIGCGDLVYPDRNNPPVGRGELGSRESLGVLGASFYFNPIELVENFCRVSLGLV